MAGNPGEGDAHLFQQILDRREGTVTCVALATFGHAGMIWPAIARLLDNGFQFVRIGIAAAQEQVPVLVGSVEHSAAVSTMRRLVATLAPIGVGDRGRGLLATPCLLLNRLAATERPDCGGRVRIGNWDELEMQLTAGALLIGTASGDRGAQWESARILLEHSHLPVRTYEIRHAT
jgi:hypothetical protein